MRIRELVALATLLGTALVAAPRPAVAAADNTVVVTVGDQTLTVADVEARLAKVPVFQLATFGRSAAEIRRGFVDKVLVPELLYSAEAKRLKLGDSPAVGDSLKRVLRTAMTDALSADATPVDDEDVRKYYEENSARFNTPARLRIWRILLADRSEAAKIARDVQGTGGPELWEKLAREKSLDKATAIRGGNLGFVRPDGETETPRVRVDPALYQAADKVKDGDVVPQPVKEGDSWAVVWRRGSIPAVHRTVEDEGRSIRQILQRQRLQGTLDELITRLRSDHVRDVDEKLLDYVDVSNVGDVAAKDRAGFVPRQRHRAHPEPGESERGLR